MITALLTVVVVYRPDPKNDFTAHAAMALRRAFGKDTTEAFTGNMADPRQAQSTGGDAALPSKDEKMEQSAWESVRVVSVTNKDGLEKLNLAENDRVLWVLLVDYPMTDGPDWPPMLTMIGQRLDTATQLPEQHRVGVLIMGDKSALDRLPDSLQNLQGKPQAQLGEHRIGPHRLALLALHRARLLLGRTPGKNALKLFISHAKADGVFFADALNGAVKQVPELEAWYDAEDIPSGARWQQQLENIASQSVLIAIRTEAYSQRPVCIEEFRWALLNGVPIVVVDALLRQDIPPAPVPFAAVPTVRVADGNTHRVLTAALREHLRVLLVETAIVEQTELNFPDLPASAWRVWPRLPAFDAIQTLAARQPSDKPCCIVVADAPETELNAAASVLGNLRDNNGDPVQLLLSATKTFPDYAVQLAKAYKPSTGSLA